MNEKKRVMSFPHIGDYHVIISFFAEKILNIPVIKPPPITKKTLEIGSRYSPDTVCVPFKYNVGNFIEAIEEGANVIVQAGGGCRFGYYPEVQEQILKDLDYDVEFLSIIPRDRVSLFLLYKRFKEINSKLNFIKFSYYLIITYKMVKIMEWAQDYINKNVGFEIEKGSFNTLYKKMLAELGEDQTLSKIRRTVKFYKTRFREIAVNKPSDCLKVAVLGEIYLVLEEFSNCYVEKQIAEMGVEVFSPITASYILFRSKKSHRKLLKRAGKYLTYAIGADGTDSVVKSKMFAEIGYDGIIHVKPFACIPEVNAMPMLQKISEDYKIPILYLSYDSQTSEAGVTTRLEAFYDMLKMKKSKKRSK